MKLMAIDKLKNKHTHFLMGSEAGSVGESGQVLQTWAKAYGLGGQRLKGEPSSTALLNGHVELTAF